MPSAVQSRLTDDTTAYTARNVTISRRLVLALIVFCAAMMLLGPTIADSVLSLLGCRASVACTPIVSAVSDHFAVFHRADQLSDVPVIFVVQFWPVVIAWIALILYVRYRKPPKRAVAPLSPIENLRRTSLTYRWTRHLAWASLVSVIAFCVLFGTPFLATETARVSLSWLGCEVDPWRIRLPLAAFGSGSTPPACLAGQGFWIPRLRDYVSSAEGWFIAPLLLATRFGALLLVWLGISALFFALARFVRWRELGE